MLIHDNRIKLLSGNKPDASTAFSGTNGTPVTGFKAIESMKNPITGVAAQREQMQLEREKAAFQAQLERENAVLQAQLEQEKTRQAIAIEWEKAKADAEIEAFKVQKKADLDARVAAADAAVQAKLAEASARDERVISNTDSAMKVSQGIGDHLSKLGDRLVDVAAMQQNLLHRRTRRVIKKDAQGNRYADEFPVDAQGNEILMH